MDGGIFLPQQRPPHLAQAGPAWIQAALDVLTVFFNRVGLHTNVNKTVGMVFQTCYIAGGNSGAADERHGPILLGAAAADSSVYRVQVGVGIGVADSPSPIPAW